MEREEECDWYPTAHLRRCLGILQQQWRRVRVEYRTPKGGSRSIRYQHSETEWRDVRQATDEEVAEIRARTAVAAPETAVATTWRCTICNNVNPDDATHCRQCEYSRTVMRDGKRVPRDGRL